MQGLRKLSIFSLRVFHEKTERPPKSSTKSLQDKRNVGWFSLFVKTWDQFENKATEIQHLDQLQC